MCMIIIRMESKSPAKIIQHTRGRQGGPQRLNMFRIQEADRGSHALKRGHISSAPNEQLPAEGQIMFIRMMRSLRWLNEANRLDIRLLVFS